MFDEREALHHKLLGLLNQALKRFSLIENGDKILVGLSGGKDSLTLLDLLAERQKIYKPLFHIEAVHVRSAFIDYKTDCSYLSNFCSSRGIPLHVVDIAFEEDDTQQNRVPCFFCSWKRRKVLFELAQAQGCNKIALGHHKDDIVQTALMNISFNGRFDTMAVRQRMHKFPLEIIRPLCYIRESEVLRWKELNGFNSLLKNCPYERSSKRTSFKKLFENIQEEAPEVASNIFSALAAASKLVQM